MSSQIPPTCPYCSKLSKKVTGRVVYPHRPDLDRLVFYRCEPCDAHVGCHPRSGKPLGRLANKELRQAKMATHNIFDPLWEGGVITRKEAYSWLAIALCIPEEECHIGMFDEKLCQKAIEACRKRRGD